MALAGGLLLLLVLAAFVLTLGRELFDLFGLLHLWLGPLAAADRRVLELQVPWYRSLPPREQRRFARRVKHFLYEKDWTGAGMELTRPMRVRIAATAVRITWGMDAVLLLHFSRIVVYPDAYRDPVTGRRHLGGVAPGRRTIALSWRHFEAGEADPTDARNLGLHEMAHALWLEDRIPNAEDGLFDPQAMAEWRTLAEQEALAIREDRGRLFRAYAATDQAEFFAVAVEYFFEQPALYKERMPDLYASLAGLLKQDPLAVAATRPMA
jgi:Mlc titration factor MtfA (ptsG expression regulator)